jgi:hypothetical protein
MWVYECQSSYICIKILSYFHGALERQCELQKPRKLHPPPGVGIDKTRDCESCWFDRKVTKHLSVSVLVEAELERKVKASKV